MARHPVTSLGYHEAKKHWHTWFAWWPVVLVDGRRAWWQYVERRVTHWYHGSEWEYRVSRDT